MKRLMKLLALTALTTTTALSAADTDTVTVTFTIDTVRDIVFSGDPAPFTILPGLEAVVDSTTTYAVTTNANNQRITAALDTNMPAETLLEVQLAPPTGATAAGFVTLTTVAADLVTGITDVDEAGLLVTYRASATVDAIPAAADTRTITYTILDGA